jgi:plastocyanin
MERFTVFHRIIVPLMITLGVVGCGSSTNPNAPSTTGPGTTPVSAAQVNATPSLAFTPATIALTAGGTVTFVFSSVGHNVFFDNDPTGAPAAIGGVNANTSVQRTFPVAGTYNYNCHIHPGMHGTITVSNVAASTDGESPGSGSANHVP